MYTCLSSRPLDEVPITWASKSSTKLCKCTVIDFALGCLSFRESRPKSIRTVEEQRSAGDDNCFITQLPRVRSTRLWDDAGIPCDANWNGRQSGQSWRLLFLSFKEWQWCCSLKCRSLYSIGSSFACVQEYSSVLREFSTPEMVANE